MSNLRSLGTQPSEVHSDKYVNGSVLSNPADSITFFPGRASNFNIKDSMGFVNHSNIPMHKGRMVFDFSPTKTYSEKHGIVDIVRTSGNLIGFSDFKEYGPGFTNDDHSFGGWIQPKGITSYDRERPNHGFLIEGSEMKIRYNTSDMPNVTKFTTRIITIGPIDINTVGRRFSENCTSKQLLGDYSVGDPFREQLNYIPGVGYSKFTNRSVIWKDTMDSEGINNWRELKGIGAADLSKMNALAVTIGKKYVVLSNTIISGAWKKAHSKGLSGRDAEMYVKEFIEDIIEHETYHMLEPDNLPKSVSEERIASIHYRKAAREAEMYKGTSRGMISRMLAKHWKAYAERARSGGLSSLNKSMNKLEALAAEAIEEAEGMGLEGEALDDYVANAIEEYVGENIEEDFAEGLDEEGASENIDSAVDEYLAEAEEHEEAANDNETRAESIDDCVEADDCSDEAA